MFTRRGSLIVAQNILGILDKDERLANIHNNEDAVVGTFYNGREQGYTITIFRPVMGILPFDLHISFAEQKSSDDIVVYQGKPSTVDIEKDEAFWNSAKYFRYNQLNEAAEYIYELIMEFYKAETGGQ